jgi:hypothetical protein
MVDGVFDLPGPIVVLLSPNHCMSSKNHKISTQTSIKKELPLAGILESAVRFTHHLGHIIRPIGRRLTVEVQQSLPHAWSQTAAHSSHLWS